MAEGEAPAFVNAMSAQELLATDWRALTTAAQLKLFLARVEDTQQSKASGGSTHATNERAALRQLAENVARHQAAVALTEELDGAVSTLTNLERAVDAYAVSTPGPLHEAIDSVLASFRATQSAADALPATLTVPVAMAAALGDTEGSNPELMVRRQLVALDDLATHEDMKRRTATALRDFLVSELGSQSGGPTTKEGNKNTRPVGEGEPQDGNAEIVAPHKKRTKS